MAYYQLSSNNPNFSHIIEKNPATGLQLKKNRKGTFFFWFSNDQSNCFNILFKDASDEMSYPENKYVQFEYLNASKYSDARCLLDVCQNLLHATREHDNEHDSKDFENKLFINIIETQYKTLDIFRKYFEPKGYKIEFTEIVPNNYSVTITSENKTLKEFISFVNVFALFATLNSPNFYYITDYLITKYLKLVNYLDVPYFIKYLLKIRLMRKPSEFAEQKEQLDLSNEFKFDFKFGDTHEMRITYIKSKIEGNNPIIDLGTGIDFKYLKIFAPSLQEKGKKYYAVDLDEEARFKIKKGVENRALYNVSVHESIDNLIEQFSEDEPVDILCTEVLEHNTIDDAKDLIDKILTNFEINQLILTVPNVDFNKNYAITKFRHDDHKWEISLNEFMVMISERVRVLNKVAIHQNKLYQVEFHPIGDKVNDISVTSCAIITQKKLWNGNPKLSTVISLQQDAIKKYGLES